MEKQELLEAIAPYFPHNVKCLHFDDERGINHVCTIEELNKDEATLLSNEYEYFVNIDDVNLILRPLSDLTKPCLEGGKVPIVELAKMCGYNNLEQLEIDGEIEYGWSEHGLDDYQGYSFGWSRELKTLGVWLDHIEGSPISIDLNLDVVQFMYKHHFDIHGLIEKGCAVDINTIR